MDFLLLLFILYLSWLLLKLLQFITNRPCSRNNLPPGPRPLPLLGNLLELGSLPHKSLARLAKTHGPLMSLKLGQVTTIVVSSASVAREILKTHDLHFSNRTIPDVVRAHGQDELGLPWVPISPLWRALRRICNVHLFAQSTLDANHHLRREKVQELLSYVGELAKTGKSVDIGEAAFMTSLNLISNTMFSVDLAGPRSGSSSAREFKEIVEKILVEAGKPNISDYFPALKAFDMLGSRRRMTGYFGKILHLSEELINKRVEERNNAGRSHDLDKKKNDLLDVLLDICEDKKESIMEVFRIKHLSLDLIIAGTDTTSNTVEWAMAELVRNPDMLSRAQAELNQVIGQPNRLEESDIPRLPYLQAVVKETLRLHPPVPLSIPRKVGSTIDINGYTVPEGAQLLINAWAMGRDTSSWKDTTRKQGITNRYISNRSNLLEISNGFPTDLNFINFQQTFQRPPTDFSNGLPSVGNLLEYDDLQQIFQ